MRLLAPLAVIAVVLAGWGGTMGHGPNVMPVAPVISGVTTDAVSPPPQAVLHPLAANSPVRLTLVVASRDPGGLTAFDRSVIAPGSPDYRQFLAETTFEQRFGPVPGAASRILAYLGSLQARDASVSADGWGVSATLTARAVSVLVGGPLMTYAVAPGGTVYTLATPATLPSAISSDVSGIDGLSSSASRPVPTVFPVASGQLPVTPADPGQFVVHGSPPTKWYIGSDYAQAYGVSSLLPPAATPNASFATHEAVATILMSGYNSTTGNLPPFDPRAVNEYFNHTFPSTWPRPTILGVPVNVSGILPPPPGPLTGGTDTTFDQVENSLDLEMAGSMAPGAVVANFYYAASLFDSATSQGLANAADTFAICLGQALIHNYGAARLTAVTNSYGLPDLNDSMWNTELLNAAALGVTVFAASGDQGNAPPDLSGRFQGQWPVWPATAAFSSTGSVSVGGTTVDIGGTPTGTVSSGSLPISFDANLTGINQEVTWYDPQTPGNYSGSEGGASVVFPEPAWQFASAAQWPIVNATGIQGLSSLGRSGPDVAFAANATVIYVSESLTGISYAVVEGTSISSPLFAGMIAESVAVSGHKFGFLTPELYRIGSYYAIHPGPTDPFRDTVLGGNYLFTAAAGWDPTTGWGSVNAPRFLAADANSTIAGYIWTGPTPGLPSHAPPGLSLPPYVLLGVGVGLAVATGLVLFFGRPRRPAGSSAFVPPGALGPSTAAGSVPPPPPGGSWATFICPYCGKARPAEAGRCPSCGAY